MDEDRISDSAIGELMTPSTPQKLIPFRTRIETRAEWDERGATATELRQAQAEEVAKQNLARQVDKDLFRPVSMSGELGELPQATIELHKLCDIHRIQPSFYYEQVRNQEYACRAELVRHGELLSSVQSKLVHLGKKDAKEDAAEQAILGLKQLLPSLEHDKRMQTEGTNAENCVGDLLEALQAHKLPRPIYTEVQVAHQSFRCTITLPLPPSDTFPTPPPRFTGADNSYANKKAAKRAAAKQALLWLQPHLLPTSTTGATSTTTSTAAGAQEPHDPTTKLPHETHVEAVSRIAQHLNLGPPQYTLLPVAGSAVFDGLATFPSRPELGRAEVARVLGRAKAREELARIVWGNIRAFMA